jgi:signal transduction histidine kinase
LATLYDGDIAVKSEPDVGSTFTVTMRNSLKAQDEKK